MSSLGAPSSDRLPLSVIHDLEHDTPKCAAGPIEQPRPGAVSGAAAAALAAHESHGLAVPVLHEVEADATGQAEGELWKGEESVAKVGGYFILQVSQLRIITTVIDGGPPPPPKARRTHLRSECDGLAVVCAAEKVSPLLWSLELGDIDRRGSRVQR